MVSHSVYVFCRKRLAESQWVTSARVQATSLWSDRYYIICTLAEERCMFLRLFKKFYYLTQNYSGKSISDEHKCLHKKENWTSIILVNSLHCVPSPILLQDVLLVENIPLNTFGPVKHFQNQLKYINTIPGYGWLSVSESSRLDKDRDIQTFEISKGGGQTLAFRFKVRLQFLM